MGDGLTEHPQTDTPYGDFFDELLPSYIAMGMTYDEYWDGEYGMKTAYRKAYKLRIEAQQRESDTSNWYMGQYLISALQAVPLLVSGLNVKRGTHLPEYPEKPFYVKFEQDKKEEDRRRNQEDQTKLAMALFQAKIAKFNQNFGKKQEAQAGTSGQ